MRFLLKTVFVVIAVAVMLGAAGVWYVVGSGVSAREQPGRLETAIASRVRNMAIARRARAMTNPVASSNEAIADGRAHFADHCAVCHDNNGSGDTAMGRGMWPKAPDMRLARTQDLTDGELFWIIENGVRFTGMPAWGDGTKEGEIASWNLVHFIRRLPKLTQAELDEMAALNPKSPDELREQLAKEPPPAGTPPKPHVHTRPHKH